MFGYLVSFLMGLAVGAAYGLVQVRSPAPPMIALIGLFGMVLGQQAVDMAKRPRFLPFGRCRSFRYAHSDESRHPHRRNGSLS
jgi:XapX domain-containing protein